MKTNSLLLGLLAPIMNLMILTSLAVPDEDVYMTLREPSVVFSYNRLHEVEKHCSSFISSASELKADYDREISLKADLSFQNGDWNQEAGAVPLMPFNDSGPLNNAASLPSPLKLVSFDVKDVSSAHNFRNRIVLGGLLRIGISKESSFVHAFIPSPNFVRPGTSVLTLAFEGIYTETERNGGERRLCLLGRSTGTMSYDGMSAGLTNAFAPSEDDQILLVLHYAMTSNLTRREIHGEMRSLHEVSSTKYFDTVFFSSLLDHHSSYQFSSKVLELTSCNPYPHHDQLFEGGIQTFHNRDFCLILDYVSREILTVRLDYKFIGKANKLGPFSLGNEIEHVGLNHDSAKIIWRHLICNEETIDGSVSIAKVAAVLRAIPPGMDPNVARSMAGLSGFTLSAEGILNPSSGQLCMVGCAGGVNSQLEDCNYRISIHFPRAFSIKQRSVLVGSISSVKDDSGSKNLLVFDAIADPYSIKETYSWYSTCCLTYNYSQFSLVGATKRWTQPFWIFTYLTQSILRYPALQGEGEFLAQLDSLSSKLLVEGYAAPDQFPVNCNARISFQMEVLSLGPLLGRFYRGRPKETVAQAQANYTPTNSQLLNVSLHLVFRNPYYTATCYKNISQLSLEGLYDPLTGEMHLIGCRGVPTVATSTEHGLDCMIEVKIQYPAENMQWIGNPTTKITIISQRNEYDPLYFESVNLQTKKTRYIDETVIAAHRNTFEGILRFLMLAGTIAVSWSQLYYMKGNLVIVPTVSLVMLAFQAIAYALSLISGAEILFKLKESEQMARRSYVLSHRLLPKALDCAVKLLLLVALLLTARIFQMVAKSRNRQLALFKNRRHVSVPHSKLLFLITLAIYTLGPLTWLVAYNNHEMLLHLETNEYLRSVRIQQIWMIIIEDFTQSLLDFFLLPQIVCNWFWQTQVISLRKLYYIGLTLVRVLVHLYSHIRDPISDIKDYTECETVRPNEATAKFSNITVVLPVILIAVIVHVQQNWKCQRLSQLLNSRRFKLMPFKSNVV